MSSQEMPGDYPHGIFKNSMLKSVVRNFGAVALKRCSVMMEFEHFLQQCLMSKGRGGTALEIGTFQGISAIVMSQYFDRVICVSWDVNPDELIKHEIIDHLGIKNIRFFDCRDESEKKTLINQLDFSFCYQDGNHLRDTYTDFDLVRHCGRILFHEYWPIQPSVWNLVNSLPQHEVKRAQFDCLAYWERS